MGILRGTRVAGVVACFVLLGTGQLALGEVLTPASAAAQQFPGTSPSPSPAAGPSTAGLIPGGASPSPAVVTPSPAAASPSPAVVTPSPVVVSRSPGPAPATPAPQPQETPAVGPNGTVSLQPFNTVVSCAPFNILVTAAKDNTYGVTTNYAPELADAIVVKVEDKKLYVGFDKRFQTKQAIKINITMPAGQLNGVINNGLGDIILNPGFNTKYTIVTNKGTGRVFGRSITTNQLRIYSLGTGDVFFKGQIKLVNITAQGTGSVTLSGVDKVVGDLTGITNIFVDATSDKAPIQLNAQGISHVYYTQGDCKASSQLNINVPFFSMDMGLSGCMKVKAEAFPHYKAYWTCCTRVRGSAVCTASGKAAEAAAAQNGDISVSSSSTSSSDNEGSAASATSSGNDQPDVTVQASNGQPDAAPAATPEAAQKAADAADIAITSQAGRRLHSTHHDIRGRKLNKLELPQITFPEIKLPEIKLPQVNFPDPLHVVTVSSSSSSDGNNADADHTATSTGDGSSASSSSSSDGGHVAVASIECVVPVDQLYIPVASIISDDSSVYG